MSPVLRFASLAVLAILLVIGCESGSSDPKFGGIKVENLSVGPVELLVNGESRVIVQSRERGKARVDEGVQQIALRNEVGRVLFEQQANIPINAFAEYTVQADESVVATAGRIDPPDRVFDHDDLNIIDSKLRRIQLQNTAGFPVQILIDGVLVATVAPGQTIAVDAPDRAVRASFRRENGNELFAQTLTVPRNTTITYAVLSDGQVVATGGEIVENDNVEFFDDDD